MNEMNITSAQYIANPHNSSLNDCVKAIIDGEEMQVPLDLANRHYDEIMRQVAAGTLTIQDAD